MLSWSIWQILLQMLCHHLVVSKTSCVICHATTNKITVISVKYGLFVKRHWFNSRAWLIIHLCI